MVVQGSIEGKDRRARRRMGVVRKATSALAILASTIPLASAQSCISLSGSTQCPAFNTSSVSTSDHNITLIFPFLSFVSSTETFDEKLSEYVASDYVKLKYTQLLGCSNVNLTNTTDYYARYTTSVICNAIIQNSITPCKLSAANSPPLCADSCARQAISEEMIASDSQLCGDHKTDFMSQIRADFTDCALPSNSLSTGCITGNDNEPNNCGFANNLQGLCGFCATSSVNSTDSCCTESNAAGLCVGVKIPTYPSLPPLITSTPTASGTANSTGTAAAGNGSNGGLSGGALAGIIIGSLIGAAILLGLLILLCLCIRRRRGSQSGTVFNQPSPTRRGNTQAMGYVPQHDQPIPGGRVARMTALEANSSSDAPHDNPVLAAERGVNFGISDSEHYGDSPESNGVGIHPPTGKRNGSLSSNSIFGGLEASPNSNSAGQFSSPEGVASGQSEQLPFFKDYYSQDEIHPGDKVATLWAYQPRAGDEFELERGDMLKVVGIWDDGWATGVRVSDRAEDYDGKHKLQRDSGVSSGSGRRDRSPTPLGEIKAFPLVCVCLPEHWKKTIEGDGSTDNGSGGDLPFGSF